MNRIEFLKYRHDPQIDFVKGLCIIFVIWTHCMHREDLSRLLFPFWGDMAVPIFIIIQVFHYYKKGTCIRMPNIVKLYKRILQPFVIMVALMFITQYYMYYDITEGRFSPLLYWDKRGPGSYYIFIYLELAFIIPILAPLFHKMSNKGILVFFAILSQLIEFISCITYCPDNIYRILFFRYLFLIPLGYVLATKGLVLNKVTIFGSILSLFFLFLFNYTKLDMEPLFYTSLDNWKCCHWICYIYIAYFFLWFLKYSYTKLSIYNKPLSCVESIGRYSYEIYLFQIFYFGTIGNYVNNYISFIGNHLIQVIIYTVGSTIMCVVPIVIIKYFSLHTKIYKQQKK